MKCAVEISSGAMINIPSFIKIGSATRNTQLHSVGKIQYFLMLKQQVHKINALLKTFVPSEFSCQISKSDVPVRVLGQRRT
jgi:hypothetical protein